MNNDAVKALDPNTTLWDAGPGSVKGLHARSRGGKTVFYFYYRTKGGIQRKPKLGDYGSTPGSISLAEARRRARVLFARVATGEDPRGVWEDSKAEMTGSQLFEVTAREHWSSEAVCSRKWAHECAAHWKNHLSRKFGSLRLSEITPGVIRGWLRSMEETPRVANVALRVLSTMFNHAIYSEKRPQGTNPCMLVKAYPEKKRSRFATEEEMRAIGKLLQKYEVSHPRPVAFLYTLMFSGSRPSAIERARPEELEVVDIAPGIKVGVLTSAGKTSGDTGEDDIVIFPPQAMRLISGLPAPADGATIFGIKNPRKFWKKIREEAGCTDLWARDFRRAFASYGIANGVPIGAIGELLNHRSTQTTKRYAKLSHSERIDAASKIALGIENLIGRSRKENSGTPSLVPAGEPALIN